MDLMTMLGKIESDFFSRLDKKTGWGRDEIKKEFSEAIKNVLVTTYNRVMKDVSKIGEDRQKEFEKSILSGKG
jgi:hypothetical protein